MGIFGNKGPRRDRKTGRFAGKRKVFGNRAKNGKGTSAANGTTVRQNAHSKAVDGVKVPTDKKGNADEKALARMQYERNSAGRPAAKGPRSSRTLTDAQVDRAIDSLRRSQNSVSADNKKVAKTVLPENPTKEQMDQYKRTPNRIDIEGIDAPYGTATVKNASSGKPKEPPKPRSDASKAGNRMSYAKSRYKNVSFEDDPLATSRMMAEDLAIEKVESTDDMIAYLKDIRYDEIAPNSRWKHDPRETVKAYMKMIGSSEQMYAYRPKGKPSAAANQKKNKQKKDPPDRDVDVHADIRKGNMDPDRAEEDYARIIGDSFNRREIDVINKTGGVDLIVQGTGKQYVAHYRGKNKNDRHNVTVDPKYIRDPETITHETIHVLQEEDPKRPELDRKLSIRQKRDLTAEERSLKESLTEAETLARVKEPKIMQVPFYDLIDEKNASSLKRDDVNMIKDGMKGKSKGESTDVVSDLFDDLHISEYKHMHNGIESKRTAKEQRNHMERKK